MPYGCLGNDKCSTCMPCTPYSPCSPYTVWRQYSPWIQCPPKFGSPRKLIPKITTTSNFGGVLYEARNVIPTPPVLCSPPPYYPILVVIPIWESMGDKIEERSITYQARIHSASDQSTVYAAYPENDTLIQAPVHVQVFETLSFIFISLYDPDPTYCDRIINTILSCTFNKREMFLIRDFYCFFVTSCKS